MKCKIKWIDKQGNTTPDDNEAVTMIRTIARVEQFGGRAITFPRSEWFPCCAEHAKRLNEPGMAIWEQRPLTAEERDG